MSPRRRAWNEIHTPVFRFDDDEGATTSTKVREVSESPWQSYSAAAPDREYVALLSYLPLNRA